jgi:L-aminopeptidase/D-esterase-like protein
LKNLLTDIAGVRVGHADDKALASGVTAVIFDKPAVASIDVRGGGPGTREEALLDPQSLVETIDGIALSGGSAFGLDSASGVQAWLAEHGRGFRIREALVPIVPGVICFDLLNGGNKAWDDSHPTAISAMPPRALRATTSSSEASALEWGQPPPTSKAALAPLRPRLKAA